MGHGAIKVHIIGMAGSGKTSLARWISDAFSVPAHDLDFVVYDIETGERPVSEIVARVGNIRNGTGWVTEGAYRGNWLRPLLDEADAIVWLDTPLRSCFTRIIKRHVRAELARNNVHPGWRRLMRFLDYNRRTAAQQRAETEELLSGYVARLMRCRSSRDLDDFKWKMLARRRAAPA